ncbi:reverse transcriptase [Cucumis melo var. makuwa]|uniref:Reverse transcriptase n=1 Tax=Cucumis melo var. makuwa TaxID=1194695 RepID=A0A5D3CY65_CUCMM|nr:reverse transcriptase [Cucumis melo var. makuwa]
MVPLAIPLALIHEYEPTQAQGITKLNNHNLCVEDDIVDVVEDDRTNIIVPKANKTTRSDETLTDIEVLETSPDDSDNNLSPKFRAFASLDTTIIPKNIREATKSPEWKMVVMEEMGAFEKNKT